LLRSAGKKAIDANEAWTGFLATATVTAAITDTVANRRKSPVLV